MSAAVVGRAIAALGVVLGLIAIWLDFASVGPVSTSYSNDGTVLAYLLVTLVLTTLLLGAAMVGTRQADLLAAVTGSAAFGFYLFAPASFGFNHFDVVDTGGWLGVSTVLIPLGMAIVLCSGRARAGVVLPRPVALTPVLVGRVLCSSRSGSTPSTGGRRTGTSPTRDVPCPRRCWCS